MELENQRGLMILELALVMALVSLFLTPLIQLQHTIRAGQKESQLNNDNQLVEQALQGFIMSRGRLPCPASGSSLEEARENEECEQNTGSLPLASLGLTPNRFKDWRLTVATLESAGSPAAHTLFKDRVLDNLSLQALTEIILQPETPSNGLEQSALPAIHLCLRHTASSLPEATARGCGSHPLHSPTAVAVFYSAEHLTESNINRSNQFFIEPHTRHSALNWISFEQFIWLRTMSGHTL